MCRECKYYRPDERYRGVIGWCDKKNDITDVNATCNDEEAGEQYWLCGEPVERSNKNGE